MSRKKIIHYVNVITGKNGSCSEKKWEVLIKHPIGRGRFRKIGEDEIDVPDRNNMIVDRPDEEE